MKRYLIAVILLLSASAFGQGTLAPTPHQQFLTNTGAVCSGCTLTTYLAGSTTLSATYADYTLTTANPTEITLNSAGRPSNGGVEIPIYLAARAYKFVLKSPTGSTIWTQDEITVPCINCATPKRCIELTQESDGSIATDASLGNQFCVTITKNATLSNPTSAAHGQTLLWQITMGGSGSYTLALGNAFTYTDAVTAILMPTAAGKRCWIAALYDSDLTDYPIMSTTKDQESE